MCNLWESFINSIKLLVYYKLNCFVVYCAYMLGLCLAWQVLTCAYKFSLGNLHQIPQCEVMNCGLPDFLPGLTNQNDQFWDCSSAGKFYRMRIPWTGLKKKTCLDYRLKELVIRIMKMTWNDWLTAIKGHRHWHQQPHKMFGVQDTSNKSATFAMR